MKKYMIELTEEQLLLTAHSIEDIFCYAAEQPKLIKVIDE